MKPTPKADQVRSLREARATKQRVQLLKKLTAAPAAKPITAPVQASAPSQETTMAIMKTAVNSKPKKPAKKAAARKPAAAKTKPKAKTTAAANARTKVEGETGGVRPGSKLEIVVGLLTRPEGCTTADILAACEWPTVSVPQQAKAAGLTLRKEKDGKVTRYWGAPASA